MERRKRSVHNAALAPELVWKIKQLIIEQQWSSRQISGGRKKERILQEVQYAAIHNLGKFKGGSHEEYWGFSSSGTELC